MKICNNKKYRTRSGQVVVIDRKRVKQSLHPVRGRLIRSPLEPLSLSWTEDGYYYPQNGAHRHDLVEVVND